MMFVNPVVFFFFSCFLQRTLVGLVRDLRGIAFAFNAKTSFMMLFDWMYPFSRDTVRLLTARWTVIIFIIHHSRSENVPERRLQISSLHAHSAASHRALVPRPSMHHARPQTHGRARPQQVSSVIQMFPAEVPLPQVCQTFRHSQRREQVQIWAVKSSSSQ